jgi:DNA-directed RNA polymerase subunit RPC12/RpoP
LANCILFTRIKFKSSKVTPNLIMKALTILGAIAAVILFFFAIVFAQAASVQATASRLITSGLLFIIGLAVIMVVYYMTRKPKTIVQQLEISGQMKGAAIKCPNCGASLDANQIKIVSGVPYVTCPYCGTTFEVTEEPKW